MVFSSLFFVFGFLPIALALYYLVPMKAKNLMLLAVSLVFYAWGEPVYVVLMVLSIAINYAAGREIGALVETGQKARAKTALLSTVVVDLGVLGFYKYAGFFVQNFNAISPVDIPDPDLALPIGISFYTFQVLSYIIDVYRGHVEAQRNIITFGAYVTMFPQLIAGPIVRYSDVEAQLKERSVSAEDFASGICRFVVGLGKKVLLANQIGALWDQIYALGGETSVLMAWLGAIAYTFQIYFDFSGYSDMAIGLGRIFGFKFPENFRYPYESKSITEFWRRWHITLSTWFKEYLYIPLGGNRKGMARQILNLLIVWALTGFWHGAGWNFVMWGLYYFLFLVLEKLFMLKVLDKLPAFVRHIYALFIIVIGWVIFACDDTSVLLPYLGSMFGANGLTGGLDLYLLTTRAALLVILCIASTQLPKRLAAFVGRKLCLGEESAFCIKAAATILLLALCMMFLVVDSYNPFLYFRF